MNSLTSLLNIRITSLMVIFRREFFNYFNTPIGYVFLGVFFTLMNFLFFIVYPFWNNKIASMEVFFELIRYAFIVFIPAVTMRLWSEEHKSGTLETLMTLSIRESEAILGKFLSALAFVGVALAGTILIPITIFYLGSPDLMLIFGGYLGTMLLAAAYISLGLLISFLTKDQIVAFILGVLAFFILFIMGYFPFLQLVGGFLAPAFEFLSGSSHFESIARGVLDTRDVVYFISFTALMLYLNQVSMQAKR